MSEGFFSGNQAFFLSLEQNMNYDVSHASLLRAFVHAFRLETVGSLDEPPVTGRLPECTTRQPTNARRHQGFTRRDAAFPELRRRVSPRRRRPLAKGREIFLPANP